MHLAHNALVAVTISILEGVQLVNKRNLLSSGIVRGVICGRGLASATLAGAGAS